MDPATIFAGLKVIDCATFIAGPAAATIMADFGADVVKVEPPGQGDPYRHTWRNPGAYNAGVPYTWIVDNRSKRSAAIDLKVPEGREALYALVRTADVFITNLPFPVRERLGIRWEDLRPLNPRLIYASLTAYGEHGPERDKTGFDATALWARTGLMDLVKASADAPPARSLPGMGDHPTAIALYGAIATALYTRERTGEGTHVASSLMANGIWWNALQAQGALCGGDIEIRGVGEDAPNALHNLYRCRDGRWFHLIMITQAAKWPAFCAAIERPDLATDPRFAEERDRAGNARALSVELGAAFARRDWAEWKAILTREGITFGEVARMEDVTRDEQAHAAGVFVPLDDPTANTDLTVSSPLWVGEGEKAPARAAPALGAHTDEVLREAGLGDSDIERLRAARAIE